MKYLIALLVTAVVFTGCTIASPNANMSESDFFEDYGLTFSYPSDLVLSVAPRGDMLILDEVDRSNFEGQNFGLTTFYAEDADLDETLEVLSEMQNYEQVEYPVNDLNFVKVSYDPEIGEGRAEAYYLDLEGAYFMFSPGSDLDDVDAILSTVEVE